MHGLAFRDVSADWLGSCQAWHLLVTKAAGQQAFPREGGRDTFILSTLPAAPPSVSAAGEAAGACLGPHAAADPPQRVIGGLIVTVSPWDLIPFLYLKSSARTTVTT